jgi:hypothetical protein
MRAQKEIPTSGECFLTARLAEPSQHADCALSVVSVDTPSKRPRRAGENGCAEARVCVPAEGETALTRVMTPRVQVAELALRGRQGATTNVRNARLGW